VRVVLVSVGSVGERVLSYLRNSLESKLRLPVEVSRDVLSVPRSAYDWRRGQYLSSEILRLVVSYALVKGIDRALGIADLDAYVSGLNFVFGEAVLGGRGAVVYLARLRPEFYSLPPSEGLFLERALKECMHELGHTFGLRHCGNPLCVMHFSNSIADTDRKLAEYCNACRSKLARFLEEVG